MTVIGINGSPRKNWNTATLLTKALEGAASQGAQTELVHLYDLDCKGCTSCFACKTVGGSSYGRCALKDGLTPILKRIEEEAEALILGTPVYLGAESGEMRSFMERLLFPFLVYSVPPRTLFPRRIRTAVIYAMNATEETSAERGYGVIYNAAKTFLGRLLGETEILCSYDTYQFPDYSKVIMESMDPVKKRARREKAFPEECRKAFELGCRMASKAS